MSHALDYLFKRLFMFVQLNTCWHTFKVQMSFRIPD